MASNRRSSFASFFALLFMASEASANAGVPMIVLVLPAFVLSLIPIILIEAFHLSKQLHVGIGRALRTTAISNLVSTFVGIPLTWLLLVVFQMLAGDGGAFGLDTTLDRVLSVTLQAPWLIPYESDLHWMIPAAGLVLLVPFFFVSWWSEYLVSKRLLVELQSQSVRTAVRNANMVTYALLAIWPAGYWVLNNA